MIILPGDMRNIQLFVTHGKLIVLGGKTAQYNTYQTSMVARDQKASILVYDVSRPEAPRLQNAYEYDGTIQESRVADGKLILVTSQMITRGPVYMMRDKMMQNTANQSIQPDKFTFTAHDLLPTWTALNPTTITYKNGSTKMMTTKTTTPVDCTNVLYKKPDPTGANYPQW